MDRLTKESDNGGLAFTFDLDVTCKPSEIDKIVKLGEKLKAYEDTGLTPEQLREIDKLYAEKCKELAELQKCVVDMFTLLDEIKTKSVKRDMSLFLTPGIGGANTYQWMPPLCRIFDSLIDKHGGAVNSSFRAAEMEK